MLMKMKKNILFSKFLHFLMISYIAKMLKMWLLLMLTSLMVLTDAGKVDREALERALNQVYKGKKTEAVARDHGIPPSTLRDYLSGWRDLTNLNQNGAFRRILTIEQENDLTKYAIWMSDHGFPITTTLIQTLASEISGLTPTLRWAQKFVKRNQMSLRKPNEINRGKCSTLTNDAID